MSTRTATIMTDAISDFPQPLQTNSDVVARVMVCPFQILSSLSFTVPFDAIRRGADKSLAFPIFITQPKEFFLDGLKKFEQRSHMCVELGGGDM
jgi:hypothetical protein